MSNAEFPRRTAGELTLPNGDVVWVCTLNTLLKEQADSRARRYAQNECICLLKGGVDYPGVLAEIRSFSAEKQAQYLAQQEFYPIRQDALGKYPDPQEPEQGDLEPEGYAKAVQKWESDCKAASARREKHVQTRYDAEIKRALALTEKVRVERCVTAYFSREFSRHFVERLTLETLYRAVRRAEDRSARYFASPVAVEDAEDAVREALIQCYYHDLDTVKPDQVPT